MDQDPPPLWLLLLVFAVVALLAIALDMAAFAIKAWIAKHILGF